MSTTDYLTPFEGRSVVAAGVEVPGAAGGLREALEVQPVEVTQGQKVYMLFEMTVGPIRFDPIMKKGEDTQEDRRVHVMRVNTVAIVDAEYARRTIDAQKERIRIHREAEAGISHLPGTSPADPVVGTGDTGDVMGEEEAFTHHHQQGLHRDGIVEGCPLCPAEEP